MTARPVLVHVPRHRVGMCRVYDAAPSPSMSQSTASVPTPLFTPRINEYNDRPKSTSTCFERLYSNGMAVLHKRVSLAGPSSFDELRLVNDGYMPVKEAPKVATGVWRTKADAMHRADSKQQTDRRSRSVQLKSAPVPRVAKLVTRSMEASRADREEKGARLTRAHSAPRRATPAATPRASPQRQQRKAEPGSPTIPQTKKDEKPAAQASAQDKKQDKTAAQPQQAQPTDTTSAKNDEKPTEPKSDAQQPTGTSASATKDKPTEAKVEPAQPAAAHPTETSAAKEETPAATPDTAQVSAGKQEKPAEAKPETAPPTTAQSDPAATLHHPPRRMTQRRVLTKTPRPRRR
jgi:hypothetical protein